MAYEFYITIEGTSQGKFKGESDREKHKDKLAGFQFRSAVVSPRESASGQATGKRRHEPVVVHKKIGKATPMISKALCTNEVLKSVLFEFMHTNEKGEEEVVFTIKLTNATVSSQVMIVPDPDEGTQEHAFYEEVQFTFQKIEWEHTVAKTVALDDWKQ